MADLVVTVHRLNEISLFGTRYPIVGSVDSIRIDPFPEKQVTGDISKEDSAIDSTWIFVGNQTGGIGVLEMLEEKDADRCWFSDCWIQTNGHLLLGALVTSTTNPSSAEPAVTIEYNNLQYCAFGSALYSWSEGAQTWGSSLGSLVSTPTDVIVHKNKMYLACGSDFNRYDGSTLTTGAALASPAKESRYFVEWDDKLFTIANDGTLRWTIDEGVTWITSATSDLPSGSFNGLHVGRNAADDFVIYLGTTFGTLALDFDGNKWVQTELTWPQHEYAGQGSIPFEDASYITAGMTTRKYRAVEGRSPNVGLDRNDGLPEANRGNTISLRAGHREMYNLVDATSPETQDLFPAGGSSPGSGVYGDVQIYDSTGASIVARYINQEPLNDPQRDGAWSVVYAAANAGLPARCMSVSTADGNYRLWFGIEETMKYVDLQRDLRNPTEIDGFKFDNVRGGEHLTPRFDADKATAGKLARRVRVSVTDTSTTEYIKMYYRIDAYTAWTNMTNSTFADGQIDTDGEHEFSFSSDAGTEFDAIQFKVELYSGNSSRSPDMRWARLEYLKQRDPVFGFSVTIDCIKSYRHTTGKSRRTAILAALETGTLGEAAWMDAGSTETHRVRVDQYKGTEAGGRKSHGLYDLVLIAP
jgi:hypothetical protein